jgi:predicted DNA binding protein
MLVREVGERAAAQTGLATLQSVTPSTLRRYFARQLLVEHGVDARVVAAVGGWEGVDGLLRAADDPTREEIAASFERLDRTEAQPGRLSRLIDAFEAVEEAIIAAGNREAIERVACAELTSEVYQGAWLTERDRNGSITVRAHAGEQPDRFEVPGETGIVRRALQTGQTLVTPDSPGLSERYDGRGLLAAVPLTHGETSYGTLVVQARTDAAFEDAERTALTALGRRLAATITATERKQLLFGSTVLELDFAYQDRNGTLLDIAARLDCRLSIEGIVPDGDGSLLCFVEVRGATAERTLEVMADAEAVTKTRLIRQQDDGGTLEVRLERGSPANVLAQRGATVTDLQIESDEAQLVCEVSPETDVRSLGEALKRQYPSVRLQRKREQPRTTRTPDIRDSVSERLTDKQRAVLETAYHAGYFEWPRASTAEDLADSMGVASPTLHNHLRKAQKTLLASLLEDE